MIPFLGFTPDVDPATPGAITDCTNWIPYINGMEGGPSTTTPSDVPALSAECLGAAVVTKLAGTRRVLAGTATKLYELSAGAWSDVSAAGTYNATADFRWSFAQFGDTTLASNKGDTIQRSASGAFAAADASAPKAEIIFTVGSQVMALNVNDGADKPDGWHCCAINDETDWTPSLTTQAASGRLVSTPGQLKAGGRLGEFAVGYKEKSTYLGRYVGSPDVWLWQLVSSESGCVGKDAWCDIGRVHFIVGADNFYFFDGTVPAPVPGAPRQWFFDNSSSQYRYRTQCIFDRQNDRVWVFFPSTSASTPDRALVYHVKTKQWGRADRSIEAALNYVAPGLTYDTWDSVGATYDSLPNIAYDSQYWLSGGQALSIINTSHQLQNLTGDSQSSGFTTGDYGDDDQRTLLTGIRLRFDTGYKPTSAAVQTFHKQDSGDDYTTGPSASMDAGKFDLMVEDCWHKASFTFTGPTRVKAGKPFFVAAGDR